MNVLGYMIDPHTAVAKSVASRMSLGSEVPVVISSTAHYSKFSDTILTAMGMRDTVRSNEPSELMKRAQELTQRPAVHDPLWRDVNKPRYHKEVGIRNRGN